MRVMTPLMIIRGVGSIMIVRGLDGESHQVAERGQLAHVTHDEKRGQDRHEPSRRRSAVHPWHAAQRTRLPLVVSRKARPPVADGRRPSW